jgi:hypothetical protein
VRDTIVADGVRQSLRYVSLAGEVPKGLRAPFAGYDLIGHSYLMGVRLKWIQIVAFVTISTGCPFKEPRVICGTRGDPDTVAPYRAWRGSRDHVAQSPKLHERAVAKNDERECEISLAQRREPNGSWAIELR